MINNLLTNRSNVAFSKSNFHKLQRGKIAQQTRKIIQAEYQDTLDISNKNAKQITDNLAYYDFDSCMQEFLRYGNFTRDNSTFRLINNAKVPYIEVEIEDSNTQTSKVIKYSLEEFRKLLLKFQNTKFGQSKEELASGNHLIEIFFNRFK